MRPVKFNYILLAFLVFSCSTRKKSNLNPTYKDTVLKEFFQYSSQSEFYDTTNYNYKILKANFYNDTLFLKQVLADIERSKKDKNNGFPDSIRRHPAISKMEIDEAYQLDYSETFCDLRFYFTISKKGDRIKLHSVIYQANEKQPILKPIKESEVKLSSKQWDEFKHLINYTDFWSLTPHKESTGFDGDYLSVEAIIRNRFDHQIVRHNYVDRRFVSNTALYSAYSLLAKFANFQKGCNH